VAAGGDVGEVGFGEGERLLALCPDEESTVLDLLAGGDEGEELGRDGAKRTTGVVGVGEDDFLNMGTAKDTATPNAKEAKARETIAIVRGSLDGLSPFLLMSNPRSY